MTDQAQTLGEFLRTEREKRGLSLEQVSSVTKIGVRILQALERDRYSELPALPFVKGFIKTYCQLLQLDDKQVLREFDSFLKEQSKSRPNREGGMSGYAFEKPEGEQAKKMLWLIMGAMLVFGTLVVFIFKPSLKHRKHGSVSKLQASPSPTASHSVGASGLAGAIPASPLSTDAPSPTVSPTATPTSSPSPSPSPVASVAAIAHSPSPTPTPAKTVTPTPSPSPSPSFVPPATPVVLIPESQRSPTPVPSPTVTPSPSPSVAAKPDPLQSGVDYAPAEVKYKVVLRALADVWVRYQCDEKKVMKFLLKQGRILVLRGKNSLKLQVSNTRSVVLNSNGRRYPTMEVIPQVFDYQQTPTLVWPLDASSRVQEIFNISGALPVTPAPEAPEATSANGVDSEVSPE